MPHKKRVTYHLVNHPLQENPKFLLVSLNDFDIENQV